MWQEFFASFGGALGGTVAAVLALVYLSRKLVEKRLSEALLDHQHGLTEQISRLQAQLVQVNDVFSRRNEREFAVVETAWARMTKAIGTAQSRFLAFREAPVFLMLIEADALRLIDEHLNLPESQKQELRAASAEERDEIYARMDVEHSLRKTWRTTAKFTNWLETHQIFIPAEIYAGFREIGDILHRRVIRRAKNDAKGRNVSEEDLVDMQQALMTDLDERREALGSVIQRRFQTGV